MAEALLEKLDENLWVASRPLPLWIGDIGTRMTVIRIGDALLLHSPVPLDATTQQALDGLGEVRWLVGPSKVHHLYLGDYVRAYPSAELCGAPGLAEKRKDLTFHHVIDEGWASPWQGAVPHHLFRGAPSINEVVFFHAASRTLVLTDLAFNVQPGPANRAKVFHWLVGATGRFGPHRIVRAMIRDRRAARESLEAILGWDFDRVVVTHGSVLERGGKASLARGFEFVLEGP